MFVNTESCSLRVHVSTPDPTGIIFTACRKMNKHKFSNVFGYYEQYNGNMAPGIHLLLADSNKEIAQ